MLLDFEGLGSFERSEQEDMLLSVLNAAISNLTICLLFLNVVTREKGTILMFPIHDSVLPHRLFIFNNSQ